MAAELCRGDPASAAAKFLFFVFGRRRPVLEGPQLLVTGEPGQFRAIDARDDSVFRGATLEDLLAPPGSSWRPQRERPSGRRARTNELEAGERRPMIGA